MSELVERLRAAWTSVADPERAASAAAYMRDQFPFLGLSSPVRRKLATPIVRTLKPADEADLAATVRALWTQPEREFQYAGADYLRRYIKVAGPSFLAVLRELVTTKSWWDTVDDLAAHSVGPLVLAHPELRSDMDRWVHDDDFWVARTAILHQLGFKTRTDEARLFDYCRARATDREFFLRKAIGWALRQYAATAPDAVAAFVAATPSLSPLSVKEAMRGVARARA